MTFAAISFSLVLLGVMIIAQDDSCPIPFTGTEVTEAQQDVLECRAFFIQSANAATSDECPDLKLIVPCHEKVNENFYSQKLPKCLGTAPDFCSSFSIGDLASTFLEAAQITEDNVCFKEEVEFYRREAVYYFGHLCESENVPPAQCNIFDFINQLERRDIFSTDPCLTYGTSIRDAQENGEEACPTVGQAVQCAESFIPLAKKLFASDCATYCPQLGEEGAADFYKNIASEIRSRAEEDFDGYSESGQICKEAKLAFIVRDYYVAIYDGVNCNLTYDLMEINL